MNHNRNQARAYGDDAVEAAFLLGGIGTGNVSLGSRGQLKDWEIFNNPAKGAMMPNTRFFLWAKEAGHDPAVKVLESRPHPPYTAQEGYRPHTAFGLPHLSKARLSCEYPFAHVDFEDSDLPVKVGLRAYTPFIPLNADDSGIPGIVMTYTVENLTANRVDLSLAGCLFNAVGGLRVDRFGRHDMSLYKKNANVYKEEQDHRGLYMYSEQFRPDHLNYGQLALATTHSSVSCKPAWMRGEWFDNLQEFWDDFTADGKLTDLGYSMPTGERQSDTGSIAVHETLHAGESKQITFILSWYFPNRLRSWNDNLTKTFCTEETVKNYYSTLFDNAWSVVGYLVKHGHRLEAESQKFRDAVYSSTYPEEVLSALADNITVLRSPTCFRIEDGAFFGYEGCFDLAGSCGGNCTHVWNYAQTAASLFPELERSMRKTEFLAETNEEGKMNFRAFKVFDQEWVWRSKESPAAADGQMGSIMRVFREWKFSGDDRFLRELWPQVVKTMDFALKHWDTDGDLVFDGPQHNTYDIEFYGPNPLCAIIFLGALRAAEEMAGYLGETVRAQEFRRIFMQSSDKVDAWLFNGEYFEQRLEDVNSQKYQHGSGCLSDQLLGQQLAHLYGLGYLLPEAHVKRALQSVYRNNFKADFYHHANGQRTYVLNDERGLLLCSWPNGGRPKFPFVYSDEVWTGIEYQVAVHLIYEGYVDEGLAMVKAVRERHDGYRRNPWNEAECGNHYVRSMSSWGLLYALSGCEVDLVRKELRFDPVIQEDCFSTFWSTGQAWGTYAQKRNVQSGQWEPEINVHYGDASGLTVRACGMSWTI